MILAFGKKENIGIWVSAQVKPVLAAWCCSSDLPIYGNGNISTL